MKVAGTGPAQSTRNYARPDMDPGSDVCLRATARISNLFANIERVAMRCASREALDEPILDPASEAATLQVLGHVTSPYLARAFWNLMDSNLKLAEARDAQIGDGKQSALTQYLKRMGQHALCTFASRYGLDHTAQEIEELSPAFRTGIYNKLDQKVRLYSSRRRMASTLPNALQRSRAGYGA